MRSLSVNDTVPVGDEPVTVAVHLVQEVNARELGVQLRDAVVDVGAANASGTAFTSTDMTIIAMMQTGREETRCLLGREESTKSYAPLGRPARPNINKILGIRWREPMNVEKSTP